MAAAEKLPERCITHLEDEQILLDAGDEPAFEDWSGYEDEPADEET